MSAIEWVSGIGAELAVQLLIKVAVVVLAAWGISWLLRDRSAATRHMVWTGAVLAILALPLLIAVLPRLEVEASGPVASIAERQEAPAVRWEREGGFAPAAGVSEANGGAPRVTGPPPPNPPEPTTPEAITPEAGIAAGFALSAWQVLFLVWAAGAALLLGRLAVGMLGVRRFERDATEVTDPDLEQALHDAKWLLDVDRPVRLLRSPSASIPFTWGTLRPTILLPDDAREWTHDRIRVVLLHEVAHIARRDCLTQLLAGIASAIYWIHPLAWIVARRLRMERERACDDLVLTAGERASEYASHLLDVARGFRPTAAAGVAAIAMARPSQLEGRLLALLDDARSRALPGRRARTLGGTLTAAALLPLATITLVQQGPGGSAGSWTANQSGAEPDPASVAVAGNTGGTVPAAATAPESVPAPADSTLELRTPASPGETVRLEIETGATIRVVGWDRNEVFVRGWLRGPNVDVVEVDLADVAGGVRLRSEYRNDVTGGGDHEFEIFVPARSDLDLRSAGGSFSAQSIEGEFRGGTGGGPVSLSQVAGDVDLRTGGGSVSVSNSALEGEVRTGGGNVAFRGVRGGITATTGGGNISIVDSEIGGAGGATLEYTTGGGNIDVDGVGAAVEASTGGGSISIDRAASRVAASTGGGAIRIGQVAGPVEASTGSGGVRIESAGGSVEVTTGSGSISVGIAPGARDADIDLDADNGSVTLTLPADFSGTFDIRAARNRGDGWLQSDFDLTVDSGGRATGRIGGGRNSVRIRAAGGSVILRRAGNAARPTPAPEPVNVGWMTPNVNQNYNIDAEISTEFERFATEFEDLDVEFDELSATDVEVQDEIWSEAVVEAAFEVARAAVHVGLDAAIEALESVDVEEEIGR